jgi:hypothetical protein
MAGWRQWGPDCYCRHSPLVPFVARGLIAEYRTGRRCRRISDWVDWEDWMIGARTKINARPDDSARDGCAGRVLMNRQKSVDVLLLLLQVLGGSLGTQDVRRD